MLCELHKKNKVKKEISLKALVASLEGKGREGNAKKEETSRKINKFGREGVWRVNFSS
jgi:hypothetical protein